MTYTTAAAFRRALETRSVTQSAQTGAPLVRLRKLVVFDRFLARLTQAYPHDRLLKGGLALQLRMGEHARTTQDVDVLLTLPRTAVHSAVMQAVSLNLGDWFVFVVRPASAALPGPMADGGQRFFITALVDRRTFESFHVDIGLGDPVLEPAESLTTPPLLAFAGHSPGYHPLLPAEPTPGRENPRLRQAARQWGKRTRQGFGGYAVDRRPYAGRTRRRCA